VVAIVETAGVIIGYQRFARAVSAGRARLMQWLRPRPPVALPVASVAVDVYVSDDDADRCSGLVAALVVDGRRLPVFDFGPLDLRALEAACRQPGALLHLDLYLR